MKRWQQLVLITLLAIVVRVTWGVLRHNADPTHVDLGDYVLYEASAIHFLEHGDFTASPFLVRPPLYSLLVAALGVNPMASLIAASIIGGLITPMVYALGRAFSLPEEVSLGGALLYAVDFVAVAYGAALLDSVALAHFFAVAMVLLLLIAVQSEQRTRALVLGGLAGLALVLSALTRPEIYLIWTGLSAWLFVIFRHRWATLLVYTAVSLVGLGAWTFHNGVVFGHATLSTISPYTMTFYRAASVERIGSGNDINTVYLDIVRRVEARTGGDPDTATLETRWGYLTSSPEIEDAMIDVSLEIFREYPLVWLATFPVGFIRMYALTPPPLRTPDAGLGLWAVFAWNWLFFLGAVAGWVLSVRQRRALFAWGVFLIVGYYTTGTLLVKNAAMVGRERAILTPYMALALALLLLHLWRRYRSPEPAA